MSALDYAIQRWVTPLPGHERRCISARARRHFQRAQKRQDREETKASLLWCGPREVYAYKLFEFGRTFRGPTARAAFRAAKKWVQRNGYTVGEIDRSWGERRARLTKVVVLPAVLDRIEATVDIRPDPHGAAS